jgi:hypothetical protein
MQWWTRRKPGLVIAARSRPAKIAGWTLIAAVGVAALTAYGVSLWKVPDWMQLTKPQDRHNARLLVISVGGALVVLIGLIYTASNYRLSRRGQVTDRFTIALERLGSSELYVRIGGVYALEHVMRDSLQHHNDVIEVLTEFIHERAPRRGRQVWHPVTGSVPDPGSLGSGPSITRPWLIRRVVPLRPPPGSRRVTVKCRQMASSWWGVLSGTGGRDVYTQNPRVQSLTAAH